MEDDDSIDEPLTPFNQEDCTTCLQIYLKLCDPRIEEQVRSVLQHVNINTGRKKKYKVPMLQREYVITRDNGEEDILGLNARTTDDGRVTNISLNAHPSRGFWDVPEEVANLKSLQSLWVGIQCKSFPSNLSSLQNLSFLNLSCMNLENSDCQSSLPDVKIMKTDEEMNTKIVLFPNVLEMQIRPGESERTSSPAEHFFPKPDLLARLVINHCPSLKDLRCSGINGRSLIDSIIDRVSSSNTVEEPSRNESATSENQEPMNLGDKKISICRDLVRLSFIHCPLTEDDLEKLLFDVLPRFGNIRYLNLKFNKIKSLTSIGKRASSWLMQERKTTTGQKHDYIHRLDLLALQFNPIVDTIYGPIFSPWVPLLVHGPLLDPSSYEQRSIETTSLMWLVRAFSIISFSEASLWEESDFTKMHLSQEVKQSIIDGLKVSAHPGEIEKWLRLNVVKRRVLSDQQEYLPLCETLARLYDESDIVVPQLGTKSEIIVASEEVKFEKDESSGKNAISLFWFIRGNQEQIFRVLTAER